MAASIEAGLLVQSPGFVKGLKGRIEPLHFTGHPGRGVAVAKVRRADFNPILFRSEGLGVQRCSQRFAGS
jgi:hypothetical protein